MPQQQAVAALVCSSLGCGICPKAPKATLAQQRIAAAPVQQLSAAARGRWRSSGLQQRLCSSLGCSTCLKPLVATLAQQQIAAAFVQQPVAAARG